MSTHIFVSQTSLFSFFNIFLSKPLTNQPSHSPRVNIYSNLWPLLFPQKVDGQVYSSQLCLLGALPLFSRPLWVGLWCSHCPFLSSTQGTLFVKQAQTFSSFTHWLNKGVPLVSWERQSQQGGWHGHLGYLLRQLTWFLAAGPIWLYYLTGLAGSSL